MTVSTGAGPDTSKDVDKTDKSGTDTDKAGGTGDGAATKPVTDDAKELKDTLTKVRKERDALLKAQRDAELAKLPELDAAKANVDHLTKEVEKLSLENRRYKVGMKLGLPWTVAKRLTGDTDEEMEADGAELVKSYKTDTKNVIDDKANKRPPNDAKKTGGTGSPGMNDILRALRRG